MSRATAADRVAVGAATPADVGTSAGRSVRARGRARSGILSLLAALALILGVGAGAAAAQSTLSAWTDPVRAVATVSAGQWEAPATLGCIAMNADGSVKNNGHCAVTSVVFDQWGTDAGHHRNYYVTVTSNAGNGYVVVTIDLASARMRSDTGTGTWRWENAATTGGHLAPSSACADLPLLTASTPLGWGGSGQFYLPMVDNRASTPAGSVTCR
ncbi:hypothetical protein ACFC3F_02705 [Microbacterium sp. NPDC055910]|uniref:hypothetical protein n=1 Tax=Microbacterium sp. NPDC055910 TaxID=3345659 RepID=UPI0035DA5BB5